MPICVFNMFLVGVGLDQGCPLSQILFVILMDRISSPRKLSGAVSGDLRIASLLSVDDIVLFTSSGCDLQHVVGWFETMVLC